MAFKVSLITIEKCDKCDMPASKDSPVLEIRTSSRQDDHIIFVHERCIIKAIDKAKKDAAKTV